MCHVLLHHSLPFLPLLKTLIPRKGKWGKRVKIRRDRLTMCRWIGSRFHDCMTFMALHFQLFSIELLE